MKLACNSPISGIGSYKFDAHRTNSNMTSIVDTARTTSVRINITEPSRSRVNGVIVASDSSSDQVRKQTQDKAPHKVPTYKHVLPIHSSPKISCLTQGSEATPSFVGFRNLMVLVICSSLRPSTDDTLIVSSGFKSTSDDRELPEVWCSDLHTMS